MKFLRTTPNNGHFDGLSASHFRPLAPEAFAFWQEHGAVIANLLRPETPLPLSAIVEAYADYQLAHPEGGVDLAADDAYVAWVLLKLVEYGLATAVLPNGAYLRPRRPRVQAIV